MEICIGGIKGHNGYDPSFHYGSTYGQGDIIGLAIDLDNDTVSVYKNGTVFSNINGLSIASNSNCSIKNHMVFCFSINNWYAQTIQIIKLLLILVMEVLATHN